MDKERKILEAYDTLKNADIDLIVKLSVLISDEILIVKNGSALELEVKRLYKANKRIEAIKLYRKETDTELKEAKEACDEISGYKD